MPGAGVVELELSKQLKAFATEMTVVTGSLVQYAIRKFADAFDVIPRRYRQRRCRHPQRLPEPLPAAALGPGRRRRLLLIHSRNANCVILILL